MHTDYPMQSSERFRSTPTVTDPAVPQLVSVSGDIRGKFIAAFETLPRQ